MSEQTNERSGVSDAPVAPAAHHAAVRELEGAFGELMNEFRRYYAQAAESVSPGMLPGTFKVLTLIQRSGSVTVSSIAERMVADKGQVSRAVTELEELSLVERTADPDDGRIKLITVTEEGERRIGSARAPYENRLTEVLAGWPLESIGQLTTLLRSLTQGNTPTG
jgi:DNA-binding MarR family transcriptional regulator